MADRKNNFLTQARASGLKCLQPYDMMSFESCFGTGFKNTQGSWNLGGAGEMYLFYKQLTMYNCWENCQKSDK